MADANSLAKWVWNGIGHDTGECQYYVASRSSVSSLQTPSATKAGGDLPQPIVLQPDFPQSSPMGLYCLYVLRRKDELNVVT
jgi:hypothetical protein